MSRHIICPHCQHELNIDEMLELDFDAFALAPAEGREAMTCPVCDQEFWVKGGYIPDYTTAFAEELL